MGALLKLINSIDCTDCSVSNKTCFPELFVFGSLQLKPAALRGFLAFILAFTLVFPGILWRSLVLPLRFPVAPWRSVARRGAAWRSQDLRGALWRFGVSWRFLGFFAVLWRFETLLERLVFLGSPWRLLALPNASRRC